MKRYPSEFQESVRLAALNSGSALAVLSETHGVALTTLRLWRKRDEEQGKPWYMAITPPSPTAVDSAHPPIKNDRETLITALLEDYLTLHLKAMESLKHGMEDPLKQVDAISRLSQALDRTLRALDKASPELSRLAIAHDFLEQQGRFVQTHFPQHLAAFLDILDPFGAQLANHMNRR